MGFNHQLLIGLTKTFNLEIVAHLRIACKEKFHISWNLPNGLDFLGENRMKDARCIISLDIVNLERIEAVNSVTNMFY